MENFFSNAVGTHNETGATVYKFQNSYIINIGGKAVVVDFKEFTKYEREPESRYLEGYLLYMDSRTK